MNDRVCNECGEVFLDPEGVRRHVKKHGYTYQQYALKWVYAGVIPKCKCGCNQETTWNVALKGYAEFVRGHHAWGRKKSEDEKHRIGEKNSINMKRFYTEHPDLARAQVKHMQRFLTPEVEARRLEATRQAYASMSDADKQGFRDRTQQRWDAGEMVEAREKAAETFRDRSQNGEYDFTERNQKLSEVITQKYLEGGLEWVRGSHVSTKTGRTAYYRSSWELQLMKQLDADSDVTDWESEFMSLPYKLDGITHRYIPDFHVVRGGKHQLIEVKPQSLRDTVVNEAKRQAATIYCDEMGWEYVEWSPEV